MADIMVKMDRIIWAIQSTVPGEMWPETLRKLDEPRWDVAGYTPGDDIEDCADAEDEYCSAPVGGLP